MEISTFGDVASLRALKCFDIPFKDRSEGTVLLVCIEL